MSALWILLAFALGYVAGWIRRGRAVTGDTLEWYQAGWTAALEACGVNPLKKRVRFARIDELAPKVLHDEEPR